MNFLHKIVERKKTEVIELKKNYSINSFVEKINSKNHLSFFNSISKPFQLNIIAEIKKASPSKGILKTDFNHIEIARKYFEKKVDAISILTEKEFFLGDINYLKQISEFRQAPLLRKDFIIDEIQIFESKANGADAILLIAEILSSQQIKDFSLIAKQINLDVLLELHSLNQLEKIDFSINKIIGINNRNLENFEVNLETTFEIKKHLPDDCIVISESGINNKDDIIKIKKNNINTVLVGEHFMKSENINESLRQFIEWCKNEN